MIRIRSLPLAASVVVLLIGGVYVSKALGKWNTTASKEPAKIKTGELAGMPDPADIRGSYTWLDIEKAFGISAVEAAEAFSAPGFVVNPSERVSTLETYYKERLGADKEVGTDSVRLFVSRLTGLPHIPEEGTALPVAAVAYLESKGKSDAVTAAALVDVTGAGTSAPATKEAASPARTTAAEAAPAIHVEAERKVGGTTTYGDLYNWDLSAAEVEQATGFKVGAEKDVVRDAAQASGGSFSSIKEKLQALVDAKAK